MTKELAVEKRKGKRKAGELTKKRRDKSVWIASMPNSNNNSLSMKTEAIPSSRGIIKIAIEGSMKTPNIAIKKSKGLK